MKIKTMLLGGTLLLAVSLSANPYGSKKEEMEFVIKTGEKASSSLLKSLGGELKKHLETEGPIGAVKFCSLNALALTDEVGSHMGKEVTVKRISEKFRNPANKPTASESTILSTFQTLKDAHVVLPEYLLEQVDEKTYKYYKPLIIDKGICLTCHGELNDNPKLSDYIKKTYPEDKATHYKPGDLRGAIVVTVRK